MLLIHIAAKTNVWSEPVNAINGYRIQNTVFFLRGGILLLLYLFDTVNVVSILQLPFIDNVLKFTYLICTIIPLTG